MKNNIDYNEKKKFDELFNQWWNTSGVFKTLHKINPVRLKYIKHCSKNLFNKKILDIGCGGGILSESMAKEGAYVTGLDIGKNTIKIAKQHAVQHQLNIHYICETVEQHASKNQNIKKYDIITCMELLEHIPNPLSIIQSCANILKIHGDIYFSTINRTFKSWLLIIVGAEYIFHILPKKTHTFEKFIQPSELIKWIHSTHLDVKTITGLSYDIICNKFVLSNNINVNYILHAKHF